MPTHKPVSGIPFYVGGAGFAAREQKVIMDKVEEQLSHEPLTRTRNRKPMRPNDLAKWEIRHGKYRVLYDVDEENLLVRIKAVTGNGSICEGRSTSYEDHRS